MDDKYSKLITTLKANLDSENKYREELIKNRDVLTNEVSKLSDNIQSKEKEVNSLEEDLKGYRNYPLHIVLSIFYIVTSIITELVILVMYLGYNYGILINFMASIPNFLLTCIILGITTTAVFCTSKLFYHICKNSLKNCKKSRKVRKIYKSKKAIQRKIEVANEKIKKLIERLNNRKDELAEIDNKLDIIVQNITNDEERLQRASAAFIDATLEITNPVVEGKLNKKYDEEGLETELLSSTSMPSVKRLTYSPTDSTIR